jgi:hypothetical protein
MLKAKEEQKKEINKIFSVGNGRIGVSGRVE